MDLHQQTSARLAQHLNTLPLLPGVVSRLLGVDKSSDTYFEEITRLIGLDPGFTTRVLSCANSASFATNAKPVTRLKDALVRMGATEAVNLVLASSVVRVFQPRHGWEQALWRHSLETAELAKSVGELLRGMRVDAHEAYLAGLLHDLGRFILYLEAPEYIQGVEESMWTVPGALVEEEMKVCGFDHAQLGHLAAVKWTLPSRVAFVIQHHHEDAPTVASDASSRALLGAVQIADWIAVRLGGSSAWRDLSPRDLRAILSTPLCAPEAWTQRVLLEIRAAFDRSAEQAMTLGIG